MAKIEITMPRDGSINTNKPTVRVNSKKKIHWYFVVKNTSVKWVAIKFKDKDSAHYFDKPQRPWRDSDKVNEAGLAEIHGISPGHYKNPSTEIDKYYVRGYDRDPDEQGARIVNEVDPEIVVDTP